MAWIRLLTVLWLLTIIGAIALVALVSLGLLPETIIPVRYHGAVFWAVVVMGVGVPVIQTVYKFILGNDLPKLENTILDAFWNNLF